MSFAVAPEYPVLDKADDGLTDREFVLVLHSFDAKQDMQLSITAGEVIEVVARDESGWWYGQNLRFEEGYFPSNFVSPIVLANEESKPQLVSKLNSERSSPTGPLVAQDHNQIPNSRPPEHVVERTKEVLVEKFVIPKHFTRFLYVLLHNLFEAGIDIDSLDDLPDNFDPNNIGIDPSIPPELVAEEFSRHLARPENTKNELLKVISEHETTISSLQSEIHLLRQSSSNESVNYSSRISSLEKQLEDSKRQISSLESDCLQLRQQLGSKSKIDSPILRVQSEIKSARQEFSSIQRSVTEQLSQYSLQNFDSVLGAMEELHVRFDVLSKRLFEEERLRKRLFNEVQELRGNIRVIARVRPLGLSGEETTACVDVPDGKNLILDDHDRGKKHGFEFDNVFGPDSTQDDVFESVKSVTSSVLDGYSVCIFAYGQTGSGKTYTMEGTPEHPGLNYRTLLELFRVAESKKPTWKYEFRVSVLEIYNENVFDLLSEDATLRDRKLEVRLSKSNGVEIPELTQVAVHSATEIMETLDRGYENRSIGSTNMNVYSSRSHCMLSVWISGENLDAGVRIRSRLNLVDLAGSERIKKSKAEGDALEEAKNINKSLSALGDVMASLGQKKDHVPYRNSKLTFILQDSLGGSSKVNMIVNLSPATENQTETFSSLNFASRVRSVELGQAKKNLLRVGVSNGAGASSSSSS